MHKEKQIWYDLKKKLLKDKKKQVERFVKSVNTAQDQNSARPKPKQLLCKYASKQERKKKKKEKIWAFWITNKNKIRTIRFSKLFKKLDSFDYISGARGKFCLNNFWPVFSEI